MGRWTHGIVAATAFLLPSGMAAEAAPLVPDFAAAVFPATPHIDNPFFPLIPGTQYHYRSEIADGADIVVETDVFTVTQRTRTIAGVRAVEVRDRVYEDGVLIEDTRDWFAQDLDGNVWYLGEATVEFLFDDDGNPTGTNTAGSWETGIDGALPGFIMEAAPAVGDNYYQEFAPLDAALDQAIVEALALSVDIALGSFADVLRTLDLTELQPDVREFKFYAPGIGTILVQDLDENLVPTQVSELVGIRLVPEPGLAGLAAAGMGGLLALGRRRRKAWAATA